MLSAWMPKSSSSCGESGTSFRARRRHNRALPSRPALRSARAAASAAFTSPSRAGIEPGFAARTDSNDLRASSFNPCAREISPSETLAAWFEGSRSKRSASSSLAFTNSWTATSCRTVSRTSSGRRSCCAMPHAAVRKRPRATRGRFVRYSGMRKARTCEVYFESADLFQGERRLASPWDLNHSRSGDRERVFLCPLGMFSIRILDAKHPGGELVLFTSELHVMVVRKTSVLVQVRRGPGDRYRLRPSSTRYQISHVAFKESLVVVDMPRDHNELRGRTGSLLFKQHCELMFVGPHIMRVVVF